MLLVALLVAGLGLGSLAAADATLGIVTANGEFRIGQSALRGNATVSEGTVIQTLKAPARVRLQPGPRIQLAAGSKVTMHRDRMVLESGLSDLSGLADYRVNAGPFQVRGAEPNSAARVRRPADNTVEVAALQGALPVLSDGGLVLANVMPGTALALEMQAGAPVSTFSGCLLKKNEKFVLYDQTTRIIVELRGSVDFAPEWGNRVQVIGATDIEAQSTVGAQVMDVSSLNRFGVGGCKPVADAISAQLPPEAAAPPPSTGGQAPAAPPQPPAPRQAGGMSAGAKVAIVALIGGGGAGAAFAATQMGGNDRSND